MLFGPDARLLSHFLAQVVQLRAAHVADLHDLDALDLRRVERERALDADAERLLPHRERFARAGTLALDDDAFEDLNARPGAFDDTEVNADAVAGLEPRQALAPLALLDGLDGVHHERGARAGPTANASETATPARRRALAEANPVRRPVDEED